MKKYQQTYQRLSKVTATLLLLAFLIPSGLHAKDLVDFCKTEINNHAKSEMSHHSNEMADDQSCCESDEEKPKESDHTHHDCDWGIICACNIGQSQLGDLEWITSTQDSEIQLTESLNSTPFFSSDEIIHINQQTRLAQHDPPLWLVYDTLLM